MLDHKEMDRLKQLAKGIAAQFGNCCEVVIHEVSERSSVQSIAAIENGHVSGRKVGDGPSHVVLEQMGKGDNDAQDQLCYLTRTPEGKLLKSSTMYIRDDEGNISALFCINFDISTLAMAENTIHNMIQVDNTVRKEPERITLNVNDLLDDLIRQADEMIGKPVALMTKEDKIKAIHFLSGNGALLITKSGDKIAKHFGISKYTLYSYLDSKTGGN